MTQEAVPRTPSRALLPAIYTFGAVFVSILLVGAMVAPAILGFAERVYLDLVNDVNERQARAMTSFVSSRLDAGLSEEEAIREFQAVTAGGETDRGYVCLIEQGSARYLSHPNLEQLGMDVKPGAVFDPANQQERAPWNYFIKRGATADGHLSYGPNMTQEMVYFTTVEGTGWTVSTHENLSRIQTELSALRRYLLIGSVLLSLLIAIPASASARGVSLRREARIQRTADLERRLVEEESARKSQELEQARDLQLLLLPRSLPERPEVEIAARIETATEICGDYYDVVEREDGSLLIAIGDATGHGLKSGMMGVAVKSLCTHVSESNDLVTATRDMAKTLRKMRLGRLHMAFALARLEGRTLEVVGAGMPPALIYREAEQSLEELPLSGGPLGSPIDFPYSLNRVELERGDIVLLMSDGLPELRGAEGEELGYEDLGRLVGTILSKTKAPDEIVDALLAETLGTREQELEDDVTLVVLRAI